MGQQEAGPVHRAVSAAERPRPPGRSGRPCRGYLLLGQPTRQPGQRRLKVGHVASLVAQSLECDLALVAPSRTNQALDQ